MDFDKRPGVAETLDWAMALIELHKGDLSVETIEETLGCLVKSRRDVERAREALPRLIEEALDESA
jgi:hypothetical protein